MGNFHKVVVKNGEIKCSCQLYMKWNLCYKVKEFCLIIDKTYHDPKYVDASGESWIKICDRLVKKQQQEIIEKVIDKIQTQIKSCFPETDPQSDLYLPIEDTFEENIMSEEQMGDEINENDKEG